jgi:hypothetical protein
VGLNLFLFFQKWYGIRVIAFGGSKSMHFAGKLWGKTGN